MPVRAVEMLWVSGLAAAALVFWALCVSVPAGSVNFLVSGDLFHYFWPAYAYAVSRLGVGALPEWNPFQGAGEPFLATLQPGVLYPARLLLLVARDVPTAMQWSTVAHVLLATLGTFALCRELGAGRPGAAVGAVAFGITFAAPNAFWPSYLEAGAWLPIAALGLVRIAGGRGPAWIALTGAAGGMPVLAGGYQVTLYIAYGLALLALALLVDPRRRMPLGRTLACMALAGALAAATAAPQLVPTLDWSSETARHAGALTDVQVDPYGFLRPKLVLLEKTFWRGGGFQPFYLSLPVALLALVGFVASGRFGAILGVAGLAAYLLSFGPGTAWFAIYHWLPGLSMYRFPQRLFTLVAFTSAIGAALGTTSVLRARLVAAAGRKTAAAAGMLLAVVAALVVPYGNASDFPWTTSPGHLSPPGFAALLRDATGEGRALLPADGLVLGLPLRSGALESIRVLQDYEPLISRRFRDFMFALVGLPTPGPDEPSQYTGGLPGGGRLARPTLLDVAAVRALVLPEGARPPSRTPPFTPFASTGRVAIWTNPLALPRAYVVPRARFVTDDAAALDAIVAAGWDPHGEAVLVGSPDSPDAAAVAAAAPAPARPARLVLDIPERVEVEVEVDAAAPALLVLADAWAPGWEVRVDGAPRRLWQANHLMRGVLVRPGDRRVEFRYRTPGLVAGLAIAGASWTAFAVGALLTRRRERGVS